jgi:mRNA interferase RelE/StbE
MFLRILRALGAYNLFFKRSAAKELEEIPRQDLKRIIAKVASLAENPRPYDSEKLSGQERYRIRRETTASFTP